MTVFHQMGHNSENLVREFCELGSGYKGVLASPVNADQNKLQELTNDYRDRLKIVFDPQLYVPKSERESLQKWSYFPKDVDSADLSSSKWWNTLNGHILDTISDMGINAVCSPAILPGSYSNSYYRQIADISNDLRQRASKDTDVFQTAIVRLPELMALDRVMELASILSNTDTDKVLLVPYCDLEPRREISESRWLTGVLRLVHELKQAGMYVVVAFCGPDAVLYSAAGADVVATGKFFNLRRFTPERFEPPPNSGGGQLAYWFEESLMAYLREADLVRIQSRGNISASSLENPFAKKILSQLEKSPGKVWLGHSWRQYLSWFDDIDRRMSTGKINIDHLLKTAETNWLELDNNNVLMEEPRNDGCWIRPWRIAINDCKK